MRLHAEVLVAGAGDWQWGDFKIRYQQCGSKGPPVILVHGAFW